MIHKPRVLLTVCTGSAWMHKHVTRQVIAALSHPRVDVTYMDPTHRPYEHALNRCAEQMLDDGYDYWMNMDDDNPPVRCPLDLVAEDLDYVGCPTPVYHDAVRGDRPWYFNALDYVPDGPDGAGWKPHETYEGLQEVDAIGSGCFIVSRRVIERVKRPWFMRAYDSDGIVTMGHDYLFCNKVREAGFKIHAHFGFPCRHFVETDLLSAIEAFAAVRPQGVK